MGLTNILILVSAVVLLLALWIIVGVRHLKYLKSEIREQWELLDEGLRKRHDLLPNLIETVKIYDQKSEDLFEKVILDRRNAAMENSRGAQKIVVEHDLSADINAAIDLDKTNVDLAKDTNFLELKTEINDLENNIVQKTEKYNQMVRYYNYHRKMFLLRPVAAIFRFGVMNIFEVER